MSGSGRSRENHETTGQPVARLARSRVESWTAFTTVGTPADSASASSSAATRSFDSFGAGAEPVAWAIRCAAPRRSASSRWRTAFLAATRLAISWCSWSMPWPVLALVAMTGTPVRPSASRRRRMSASIDSSRSGGTVSTWLSRTSITSRWEASGAR